MSAVLSASSHDAVNADQKSMLAPIKPIDIREGDWKAFLAHARLNAPLASTIPPSNSLTDYRRACALAYLGRRAQLKGGVCSWTRPTVLKPTFLALLEANNKADRYARYPWLEALVGILAEIERMQDQITCNSNVISIMPIAR